MNTDSVKEKNKSFSPSFIVLIMVLSAIFGFIYEEIFYYFDLGYLVKRGSTFGPWIPIYAFGGLFITIFTYRFRKNPFVIFLLNCIITGVLEYTTGFVLLKYFNTRLWDYNVEILNWGNVNGFICFRSLLFFGISSLFLIYVIIPTIEKLSKKISAKAFNTISYALGLTFLLDIVVHSIIKHCL